MIKRPAIKDVSRWTRVGKGRELQFYATNEEVASWMQSVLPLDYAPYYLVGAERVKEGSVYQDRVFKCEIPEFLQVLSSSTTRLYNFWIWSQALTPDLPLSRRERIDAVFSNNGLVLLQHGLMTEDYRDPSRHRRCHASRIAITDRVFNIETQETRTYEDYLHIYKKLHNAIRKDLVYISIVHDKHGHESKTRYKMWTERAAHKYQAGFPYWDSPGQLTPKPDESQRSAMHNKKRR
jgi:hypothetical protein